MSKKRKTARTNQKDSQDSAYFLKIFLFLVLGSLWLRFDSIDANFALPVGLIAGLLFASHEHFRLDKKIELAILLMAAVFSFFLPFGIVVQV